MNPRDKILVAAVITFLGIICFLLSVQTYMQYQQRQEILLAQERAKTMMPQMMKQIEEQNRQMIGDPSGISRVNPDIPGPNQKPVTPSEEFRQRYGLDDPNQGKKQADAPPAR